MNKDDVAGLVEELRALHVWPQFVADSHADILLPRQSKGLYGVGETAHRAANALTTLSARVETLEAALREMTDHYVRLADSGDAGNWNPRDEPVVQRAFAALAGDTNHG